MKASDPLRVLQKPLRLGTGATGERLTQLFWITLGTLFLAAIMMLQPIDWALWKLQGRLSDRHASGQIGYLHVDPRVSTPDYRQPRDELARMLDALRARGVERVFVNVALDASADPLADRALAKSMAAWGSRLTIVDTVLANEAGPKIDRQAAPIFANGHPRVLQETSRDYPNFTFDLPKAFHTPGGNFTEFGAALAGRTDQSLDRYVVSYGFRDRSEFELSGANLLAKRDAGSAQAQLPHTIVIGTSRPNGSAEYYVPGQRSADPSFVAIYGAETLLRHPVAFVPGWQVTLFFAAFLAAGAMIANRSRRRIAYGAAIGLLVYLFAASVVGNVRFELSYCGILLPAFVFFRSRSNWRHRLATMDLDTGLPTMRACERQLETRTAGGGYVAVAKIHGYEKIMQSFTGPQRVAYVMKLVERLRITDPDLEVFVDGHYLGWVVDDMDEVALRGHFEGLRAIFAAPVPIDEEIVDVGITFAAAEIGRSNAERALGAALEAVEETSEALEPIRFADKGTSDDTLWDLSLRGRIDSAMEAGEVFCVYQPKVDVFTNRTVGVEALVRWKDPERGYISPIHFVMQCEKAGRMEYLTRYVLHSACSAGRLMHFRNHDISMAVNISATLLTDMRIVGIVRNVLQATEFDPARLVLEVTETARIRDFDQARTVLAALRGLGARIAMDDFGVGAANFEAFQALPIDEIKIDRLFVAASRRDPKAKAITASLVRLGNDSRISVVAEGAETPEDVQLMREIGCRLVQGFALARPMPLTNLLTTLGLETAALGNE